MYSVFKIKNDLGEVKMSKNYLNEVSAAIKIIRPNSKEVKLDTKIVGDLGFESIDIIDLFFEIQSRTGVEIDLNEIAANIGNFEGRRFEDIKVSDIVDYLQKKS